MKRFLLDEIEYAQIEPTTRCNFSCGFCCGRKMLQQDISWETFQAAVDTFPKLRHIELQGEGEPLLHSLFFKMAEYARRKGIKVSIITNGSLLKLKDNIPKLLDLGLEKISVSIESADEEKFKEIRGGRLKDVTSGIRALIEERNRQRLEKPVIDFAVTVLSSTVSSYPKIVNLYRDLNMDGGINTQLLQRMESYTSQYSEELSSETVSEESFTQFKALRATGEEEIGQPKKVGFYKELFADHSRESNTCPWLEKGVFINLSGDMSPCCKIKNADKYGYGNLEDGDVVKKYHHLRNEMRSQLHRGEVPPACVGCPGAEPYRGRPDSYSTSVLRVIHV